MSKVNKKYGKLITGSSEPQYAPYTVDVVEDGKRTYYTPAPLWWLNENGYKPVEDTPYPVDGKTYTSSWVETATKIVKKWTEVPTPAPAPLTPAEQREEAYKTLKQFSFDGGTYTVDELQELYYHYFAEAGKEEKCEEIKNIITYAKNYIRELYPDVNVNKLKR